ncbi:hypothetical protein JTE90_000443 [Oedothorax gibbosus]|uniref:Peroxidase n=1 Tax=Oedothorax gibbosus TaxID=931172 RepID=A0AAV6UF86_9ARAC|nr:hypothetical protein JTE90_000443 [Oedothorax gibbosus]KAG8182837.1 hypothetical protein JTE90_000443 [Oedothorax gibbosus]
MNANLKWLALSGLICFCGLLSNGKTTDDRRPQINLYNTQGLNKTGHRELLPTLTEKDSSNIHQPVIFGPQSDCQIKYDILNPGIIESFREEILKCSEPFINCSGAATSKFRTIDGTCNNLKNPSWGKADSCIRRILPFDYADGVSEPRVSCTGKPLPNPRLISNVFHQDLHLKYDNLTTHFMTWGQMLSHDLVLNTIFTYQAGSDDPHEPLPCCDQGPHYSDTCVSVPVPPDDLFYPKFGQTCLSIARTIPCTNCETDKRLQWNQNTAYQDLSLIYGSNDELAKQLRSGKGGTMLVENNTVTGPMPPTVHAEELCVSPKFTKGCYKTGENRANQNLLLLTANTYILRHHNFICQKLSEVNPHWDDERLYQEARRINTAISQKITYSHYLPHVLGELLQDAGIQILPGTQYTKYDASLDSSLTDEFAAFAARYGHTLVPSVMSELDPVTRIKTKEILFRDNFYNPFGFKHGQFDRIAAGMTVDRQMCPNAHLHDDIRNFLYRRLYRNQTDGKDLATISIIRGREHGIPGYTYYRRYFFNDTTFNFNDLTKYLPEESANLLERLYESVHDIDVYSAGLAEYHVKGGFVGPTFAAVLVDQFKRSKFGDRYWFEHEGQAGSFSTDQLLEIKNATLARILCETTKIQNIQKEVFLPPSATNPVVSCDDIHPFNFTLWNE